MEARFEPRSHFKIESQKFFKSRLRMIVRVIVVPVVDNDSRFDNLCRGRLRQIHLQNLPEIALSLLFFNIPAGMSVSLPFVLNQKSHLIDMHACNHCSAGSRAQTCWAGGPVQIQDKTLTQPSPQAFSARSFLDSTISCDVTETSRGQRIKKERLGTRLTLTQALTKNW